MDKEKVKNLLEIVEGWKDEVDDWTEGYISTKYSRVLDEMEIVIKFLKKVSRETN